MRTKKITKVKNRAAMALGRLGGRRNTEAQQRARASNAQRAGRPRRICSTCKNPVVGGHADRRLDESCGAHGWEWQRAGQPHPTPPRSADHVALDAIVALMNGREWNTETVTAIAAVVRHTGRTIADVGERT